MTPGLGDEASKYEGFPPRCTASMLFCCYGRPFTHTKHLNVNKNKLNIAEYSQTYPKIVFFLFIVGYSDKRIELKDTNTHIYIKNNNNDETLSSL